VGSDGCTNYIEAQYMSQGQSEGAGARMVGGTAIVRVVMTGEQVEMVPE